MFLQKKYPKLSYPVTQWVRKKKWPTASLFEATWIYWKWLSGRTEEWGSSLSLTHTATPTPHLHTRKTSIGLVKCLSFCPKQGNPGSKVLPFMLCSYFFLLKIKTTTFSKKGKQKNWIGQLLTWVGLKFCQEEYVQNMWVWELRNFLKVPQAEGNMLLLGLHSNSC